MKTFFCTFNQEYLEKSFYWLTEPEVNSLTMAGDVTKEKQKKWFASLKTKKDYVIWGVEADGRPVGAAGMKHIDMKKKTAEYFGYIGEKEYWGKGIGTKMLLFVMDRAKEIGLDQITLRVNRGNIRAVHLYKKYGFRFLEGEGHESGYDVYARHLADVMHGPCREDNRNG